VVISRRSGTSRKKANEGGFTLSLQRDIRDALTKPTQNPILYSQQCRHPNFSNIQSSFDPVLLTNVQIASSIPSLCLRLQKHTFLLPSFLRTAQWRQLTIFSFPLPLFQVDLPIGQPFLALSCLPGIGPSSGNSSRHSLPPFWVRV
jgi:hypothetical protein